MEALTLCWLLDLLLVEEEHAEVHIRVEVDVHGQLEALDRELFNSFPETHGVIINQDVHGADVLSDLRPKLLRSFNISEVCLVEMNIFEVIVTCHRLDVLD